MWVPKVLSLMCVIVKDLSRVLRRVLGLQISEKLDPKRAEKGAFERAVALGWAPKPGTLLPECSKMDPKGNHFFCPITPRVNGQKK